MTARLSAFLVWGLLACCSGYWLLQLLARPMTTPAQALAVTDPGPLRTDLSRLLGATASEAAPEAAPTQGRFELLGVVAPKGEAARKAGEGVAVISVDGQPRTVRVGAPLEAGLYLLSVEAGSVTLGGDGRTAQTLQIAPRPAPATGQLAPAQPSNTVLGGTPPQPVDLPAQPARPQVQPPTQVMPPNDR